MQTCRIDSGGLENMPHRLADQAAGNIRIFIQFIVPCKEKVQVYRFALSMAFDQKGRCNEFPGGVQPYGSCLDPLDSSVDRQ